MATPTGSKKTAKKKASRQKQTQQDRREQSRQIMAAKSARGRNLPDIPACADPARRERTRLDLRAFYEEYCDGAFPLKWSEDHLKVIDTLQRTVLNSGQFAVAMPRGNGKTSMIARAALWAVLHSHKGYVAIIGANADKAKTPFTHMLRECENNSRLLDDFPEVIFPIWQLEGIRNRAAGQLYDDRPTLISISDKKCVMPTIPGSAASGSVIEAAGLSAAVRGMNHTREKPREDGSISTEVTRPDLLLVDDPQTDSSASSPKQCDQREGLMNGALLGLVGNQPLSVLAAVTVIQPDDVAERMLDHERNPQWNGLRTQMIKQWPTNSELWEQYADVYRGCFPTQDYTPANRFYADNRAALEEGAVVGWEARHNELEYSALQHAMNIRVRIKDPAFAAEYQNEPQGKAEEGDNLKPEDVLSRLNGLQRYVIPSKSERVTAFIDVQGDSLWYAVCAWRSDFTGYVVDYGVFPDQPRSYVTLNKVSPGLQKAAAQTGEPGLGQEARIRWGLDRLGERLLGEDWKTEDGDTVPIDSLMVDSAWGPTEPVVVEWAKASPHRAKITPSQGRGVGPANKSMNEQTTKGDQRRGDNWIVTRPRAAVRKVVYDANYWKSFIAARLRTPLGEASGLTIYGESPARHAMLADNITAEYSVRTEGRDRTVDVWQLKRGLDNHLFDALVGCAVGASVQKISLPSIGQPRSKRKRRKLSEYQ